MNLYLLTQTQYRDDLYSEMYDGVIVAAENERDAKKITPSGDGWDNGTPSGWCENVSYVTIKKIGIAIDGTKQGVILASYNAG